MKNKFVCRSATTAQDLEPIYTFRRHTSPVLCVAMNPSGEQCYSGGLDSIISVWNIPSVDVDSYDSYGKTIDPIESISSFSHHLDSNVLCKVLEGHTDAVWQLVVSGQKLLSCSSDGSVRLWDSNLTQPLQSTFKRTCSLSRKLLYFRYSRSRNSHFDRLVNAEYEPIRCHL